MAFSLKGKNVLITGSTSGIGLAIATRFIQYGAQVVVTGRRDSGEKIAAEIGARFIKADISKDQEIAYLFDQTQQLMGDLNVVINNAGMVKPHSPIIDQSVEDYDAVMNLNLRAAFQVLKLASQRVVSGGCIINTASVAARKGSPGIAAYGASKAALVHLTRSIAVELAPRNVRVNTVTPGLIRSEIWDDFADPDALAKETVALQRVGEADEAAAVFHFLASDESSYVTGADYLVDGGYCA